ncbi:hypothetical protein [Paenibacillus sp. MBLB4367]|uniref:hypothetical protein n=1 Tax=Paenibacillus sp. MBLB4367 TaxID=3384767 RepID=UPI003907FCC0
MSRFKQLGTDLDLQWGADLNGNFDKADADLAGLQQQINAETAARANADSAEQLARINADSAHANAPAAHTAAQISYGGGNVGAELAAQNARINNIVGQSGGDNTELRDSHLSPDGVNHPVLKERLDRMERKQLAQAAHKALLKHGQNIITTDQAGPLRVTIKGHTLVNLLGNAGDFEKDSNGDGLADGWMHAPNPQLVSDAKYGNKAQQITPDMLYQQLRSAQSVMAPGKYYVIGVWYKGAVPFDMKLTEGNVYLNTAAASPDGFSFRFAKVSPPSLTGFDFVTLAIGYAHTFDGAFVYEVSSEMYAKIGVNPEWSGEQLAEKLPFVNGMKRLRTPGIIKRGRNLFAPFTEWSNHYPSTIEIIGPYKIRHTPDGGWNQSISCYVDALPNQHYYVSIADVVFEVYNVDKNGSENLLSAGGFFITPSNTVKLKVLLKNGSNAGAPTEWTNPMLNLGSTQVDFEPQNNDYLYGVSDSAGKQLELAGDSISGICDELYERDGQWWKFKRWNTVLLDGTSGWDGFVGDFAGFKEVRITLSGHREATGVAEKYDGKIIKSATTGEKDTLYANANHLHVRIDDADSGWTDSLNPNANAIKAIMNGWRANGNNGSAYTSWVSILDGGAPATNTEAYVAANKAPGWTGWAKLDYVLAQPYEEAVMVEGAIGLNNGGNAIAVVEGVVVREPVTPVLYSAFNVHVINNIYFPSSFLNKRVSMFIAIYKNGVLDKKWLVRTSPQDSYGNQYAEIKASDYDPTAVYTVTSLALDKYNLTTNVIDVTAEYDTNPKMVQDALVQDMADAKTQISINVNAIAELYRQVMALGGE